MSHNLGKISVALILCGILLFSSSARAFKIENVDVEERGDFVLQPAKVEVTLNPGESALKTLEVINRTGERREFTMDIEDITGSQDPNTPVVLFGDERGPYSLKDYIAPELDKFILESGQKIALTVNVNIPKDAEPGGHYGSVLFSSTAVPSDASAEGVSTTKVVSRLGSLFFVRVPGDVKEEGLLEDFHVVGGKSIFLDSGPGAFEILFRNTGNVHMNPYGTIRITNIAGVVIDELSVEPYYSLPNSLRYRKIEWGRSILAGRYTATLLLNRGYGDIIDERAITFWVVPWKVAIGVLASIIALIYLARWFASRFEVRRKSNE